MCVLWRVRLNRMLRHTSEHVQQHMTEQGGYKSRQELTVRNSRKAGGTHWPVNELTAREGT